METFLEQAQRMETVGRMTGGIAHDFNNMLTVISGNFELIGMKMKGEEPILKSMVNMGLETVRKGKEMTQRLLAISSKQLLKPEVINLHEQLPTVIELIRRAVREDVEIKAITPANGLWPIRVDPVQFESALLNLAINARDALPQQCGRITIESSNVNLSEDYSAGISNVRPGSYVMISISDNGHGIPPDILDRVFEPFFTTKDGTKGTGLGLSMVYGFARQSGGYIVIESSDGAGTSARLFFPRSVEQASAVKQEKAALNTESQNVPTGTESLLVVEDRPDVLKYLTQTLRELGYRVTYAGDAQAALKKLDKRKNIDMLVTDVVMPGDMNGEDLAQEATRRLPHLKVLYISGYTRDALVEQGALKRGVTLLAKPFTRADLARHVRQVLDAA
jgi:nitrogen-specific signal transduction histidine kinase/ActR/RegA family two-component response regulator